MSTLSRRALLTGLLSSAAVITAGPVAKVLPSRPDRFEFYTSHFKWQKGLVSRDWQSVTRIAYANRDVMPVEFSGFVPAWSTAPDLFKMLEGEPA